jgi:uncharacterized BrkB/YihY/UPF0761 family membrane protein
MNPVERTLRRVDRYQQRHGWLGFLFAVVKKFGDDKGGNLTTLLAWNGFFALFPLLLILVTTLGFLLSRHPPWSSEWCTPPWPSSRSSAISSSATFTRCAPTASA